MELWDLSVDDVDTERLEEFDLFGFHLPMHTATRLAAPIIEKVKSINPGAHIVAFGIYAPLNEAYLRQQGVDTILDGEFERDLADLSCDLGRKATLAPTKRAKPPRLDFKVPSRTGLPALTRYARLQMPTGDTKVVGYTEATRGCKHLCRHCPVVPIYQGRFTVVSPDVVLGDIANQVAAGGEHITFGDPDFFNGPAHAIRVIAAMKESFPHLSYDVTIKVEHLRQRLDLIPWLADTGCAFVTTAVESFDDRVLESLDKGHTADDFRTVLSEFRGVGLPLAPTFVAFTPWTTLQGYGDFLSQINEIGLTESVSPIQYGIRLLLPSGSLLLDLPEISRLTEPFDQESLIYPWKHSDPAVDRLHEAVMSVVRHSHNEERTRMFEMVWEVARDLGAVKGELTSHDVPSPNAIPYMTEPWYC